MSHLQKVAMLMAKLVGPLLQFCKYLERNTHILLSQTNNVVGTVLLE